jgi:hypothetical protein
MRDTEILKIVTMVKKTNPYPKGIFIEPTKKQCAKIHQCLVDRGLTLDKFSGAFGRRVWETCCDTIIKRLKASMGMD